MNKIAILAVTALAVGTTFAAPKTTTRRAGASVGAAGAAAEAEVPAGKAVTIEQFPKTGKAATLGAPNLGGATIIGQCFTKPRKWIVLETKYQTMQKWTDQLTFTWHVLLETKSATEKDKNDKEKLAPYSYFSTSVTYANIPKGSHAASVCLHPSYLERYGEPKAVGLVITNPDGEMLAGDSDSEIGSQFKHSKWWEDAKIMDAKQAGEPMIERRQGLQDRSKTIWSLVNPNDYEMVVQ